MKRTHEGAAKDGIAAYETTLDAEQRAAFRSILVDREHTIIMGPGGVGKSYTLNRVIRAARDVLQWRVEVVAPTGVAAVTLGNGATTLHRYLGISQFDKPASFYAAELRRKPWLVETRDRICATELLIVDEISMVPASLFELLDAVLRAVRQRAQEAFGGVTLVLCGDLCQIPPVRGDYAYTSDVWRELALRRFDLGTPHRQQGSTSFAALLQRARFAELTDDDMALLRTRVVHPLPPVSASTRMCYRNVDVDAVNRRQLATLDAETAQTYETSIEYKSKRKHRTPATAVAQRAKCVEAMFKDMRAPRTLELRVGARVMMLVNRDVDAGLANGTLGMVVGFAVDGDRLPLVEFEGVDDGRARVVTPHRFEFDADTRFRGALSQLPLTLAWSITIHKSQSTTLSSAIMDLRSVSVRGAGLAYTALSRATSLETIALVGVDRAAFEADPRSVAESRSTNVAR